MARLLTASYSYKTARGQREMAIGLTAIAVARTSEAKSRGAIAVI